MVGCAVGCGLKVQGRETRVTADTRDELITSGWLGCRISVGVKPFPWELLVFFEEKNVDEEEAYLRSLSLQDS